MILENFMSVSHVFTIDPFVKQTKLINNCYIFVQIDVEIKFKINYFSLTIY